MTLAVCLICGARFAQYHPREHTCESCDRAMDEHDERAAKKLPPEPPLDIKSGK